MLPNHHEVQHQETERGPGQDDHVQGEEAAERGSRDELVSREQAGDRPADDRQAPHDVHHLGGGPVRPLVPRQQVSGAAERQNDEQQKHADEPAGLARRPVSAREEHARHVGQDGQDDQVRRPYVQVTDQPPERHFRADVLQAGICLID